MMDRERPRASDSEAKIPESWIGQEVIIETTEALSSDLRASAPVYLEDVNDRGVVMLVPRHKDPGRVLRQGRAGRPTRTGWARTWCAW
jgi:hypothetical protein